MNLRQEDCELTEPEEGTSPQTSEANLLQQAHLLHILRVTQLQAFVSQAKAKLARISQETEIARRKVKTQTTQHRNSGVETYSQQEVNELMTLIVRLEDENSQLRAISAIPVEIERLKADLQDITSPEGKDTSTSVRELQTLNASLRVDLEETQARLRAAEQRLIRSGLTEPEVTLAIPSPRGQCPLSISSQEPISRSLFPASPATKLVSVKLFPSFKPRSSRPKLSVTSKPGKTKNRGYSPTFLRVLKGRKKVESASPVRKAGVDPDDHFADSFPEECEGPLTLQSCVDTGSLPHLLFYGPPGTGKTSAILATARQLFGKELRTRMLELNASDDRGINIVRDKIKKFAQVALPKTNARVPSFKVIVLDEADSLTSDAQAALRRVVEKYTKMTRFCLICNYVSKIIDPLTSRCMKFRFKAISTEAHIARLQHIAALEGVHCSPLALQTLVDLADGDLRRSITLMQSCKQLYGPSVDSEQVLEVACVVPKAVVERVYRSCCGTFDEVLDIIEKCVLDGFQADSLLLHFFGFLVVRDEISEAKKAKLAECLAEADHALKQGTDERLTLLKAFTRSQHTSATL